MREPPQRKRCGNLRLWKIAAIHGCDSTAAKEPFTILLALCSDLSPHDLSAEISRTSSEKEFKKKKKQHQGRPWTTCVWYSRQGFYCWCGACKGAEAGIRKQLYRNHWPFSFRVRLTHGNRTEFLHNFSSFADIAPRHPALVKISRFDWEHH